VVPPVRKEGEADASDEFFSILNDKSYGAGPAPREAEEKDDDMWNSFSDVISQVNRH
jgi:hypothetical protein